MTDQNERDELDRDTRIFLGAHSARAGNDSGMIEAVSLLHRWQARAALDGGGVSEAPMPLLNYPSHPGVPWSVILPHEPQAKKNHYQTLARLRERGGLGPTEALAILENREWHKMDNTEAVRQIDAHIAALRAPQQPRIDPVVNVAYYPDDTSHSVRLSEVKRQSSSELDLDALLRQIPDGYALDHLCQHYTVATGKAEPSDGKWTCKLATGGGPSVDPIRKITTIGDSASDALQKAIAFLASRQEKRHEAK